MADVTHALEAKSDQLNAVDLMASHRVIRIRKVDVKKGDQPVSVFFDGDNNKPWKPCKGMLRILARAWGSESENWVGKHAEIYFDPDVLWAGKPVGGVRIRSMSNIDHDGIKVSVAINRATRVQYSVAFLTVDVNQYPEDKFDTAFAAMVTAMANGKMTLQSVISQCQKTGTLTPGQLKRLEDAAPDDEDTQPEDDVFPGDTITEQGTRP